MARMKPTRAYLEAKINNASPLELVIILYDGGIKFLNTSLDAFENRKKDVMIDNVSKAKLVIHELRDSLDMTQGTISENLYALYQFMETQLTEAVLEKSTTRIEKVARMLEELRETWIEAHKVAKEASQYEQQRRSASSITGLQA